MYMYMFSDCRIESGQL